jgi:ABC-type Na+ efflux pump permease subunit
MRATFAIASNTLTDLTRQKVFYFILIFALILIGSSVFMARFSFQQELQILKDISLGAMSIFSSLLAILATARLIPQDIEDRTAYTILAKPVPRFEYVIGKLLGVVALLAISIAAMSALFLALLYAREQTLLSETVRQFANAPREQLENALREIRDAGLKIDIVQVIALLFIKAGVLASLTLLVTTFATTNIFTVMTMMFVYFIGHLQATAREYWLQQRGGGWLTHVFLALVALIFPDLQTFNRVDEIIAGHALAAGVFAQTTLLGCFYIVVYTALATVMFYGKEL